MSHVVMPRKQCPQCSTLTVEDATFCPQCGKQFTEAASSGGWNFFFGKTFPTTTAPPATATNPLPAKPPIVQLRGDDPFCLRSPGSNIVWLVIISLIAIGWLAGQWISISH